MRLVDVHVDAGGAPVLDQRGDIGPALRLQADAEFGRYAVRCWWSWLSCLMAFTPRRWSPYLRMVVIPSTSAVDRTIIVLSFPQWGWYR